MTGSPGPFTSASIVVGLDGSRPAQNAARWALDEAVGRELPLHLVATVEPGEATEAAQRRIGAVAAALRAENSSVVIDTEIVSGEPVSALLAASHTATMVCVGADNGGSTVESVVAAARCPVAVVRGAGHRGWVVVELDETPDSAAVLQSAVEEARLRDAPLRVLGTWQPAKLDRRLETWRVRYPDLDVEPVAVPGSGMTYLAEHGDTIQLVVIGARNIVAVTELLGSAGQSALPGAAVLIVDRQRLL